MYRQIQKTASYLSVVTTVNGADSTVNKTASATLTTASTSMTNTTANKAVSLSTNARALATHPSLFLADEPTGALDSRTSAEIMELFHELHAKGNTIVGITHDEDVADQVKRKIRIKDRKVSEVNEG